MLNNSSDFHSDARPDPGVPTFFATSRPHIERLRESFDIPRVKHFATADKQSDGLPSVIGYPCARAPNRLEKAGAEVSILRHRIRHSADPIAGHIPAYGTRVHLTLAQ